MKRVLAALLLIGALACRRDPVPSPRLAELRETRERLRQRVAALVARDTLLNEATKDGGEVVVALRVALLGDLFKQVARRYVDRVGLDLTKEIEVQESGELKTKTFLGTVRAGEWRLGLTIHRVKGVLRAKVPRVDLSGGNRIRLALPVVLEGATGNATIRFSWDASGVANVVCHDFELTREIAGVVLPDEYPVSGSFVLASGIDTISARPEFPDKPFRLRIDLTPESWADVRRAIDEQDKFLKCGVALDPDAMMPRLKELGEKGFDVRLPRSLFRAVTLTAALNQSVEVEGQRVELSAKTAGLRVTKDTLYWSTSIRSRIRPKSVPR